MRARPRYIVLLISLTLLLLGTAIGSNVLGGFSSVSVTEIDIQAPDGATIHCTLQKPGYATDSEPLPGVLVIHGSLQSKEWLMAFGIELGRRGFVVLTMDANGHGDSDAGNSTLGATAALDYLANLDYVDNVALGIIGHSMGGGHAWRAIENSAFHVSSLVLVGAGAPRNISTVSYIPNMLVAVGDFDSLSSYSRNTTSLEPSFNVTPVEAGITYGDFSSETARKLFVARTNHLFETIDPSIVSESVEWMKDSLKGGLEDSHWRPSSELVFQMWLFGGLLSLIGAVLTIFPILSILIDLPFFKKLKQQPEPRENESGDSYIKYGLLFGVLGLALFYPLMAVGTILGAVIYIPMANATPIVIWLLGTGLISLFLLRWILNRGSISNVNYSELSYGESGFKSVLTNLVRPGILGLFVVGWLYAWTIFVDIGMALDIRCFLPGFNLLTPSRALFMVLYFVVFLVYFYVEGMWLIGTVPTTTKGSWFSTQFDWTMKAILVKSLPYLVMLGIEFGGGMLFGVPIIPGYIGYTFLFFYAFTPWFIGATVVMMWSYRLTNDYRLGALINAMVTAWLMATILSFPSWFV